MSFDWLSLSANTTPLLGSVEAFTEGSGMSAGALQTAFAVVVLVLLIVAAAMCVVSTLKPWGKADIDVASLYLTLGVAVTLLVTGGFLASYFLSA